MKTKTTQLSKNAGGAFLTALMLSGLVEEIKNSAYGFHYKWEDSSDKELAFVK